MKIPIEYEFPLDYAFISVGQKMCPYFRKLNMTANHLTFISLCFGILTIICLFYGYKIYSIISYLISHFFDDIDGYYARKYNQVSEFGDKFDHSKDFFINLILLIMIFYKLLLTNILFGTELFIFGLILHYQLKKQLGTQERYYNKNESKCLEFTKKYCTCEDKDLRKELKKLKWFGSGLMILYMSFLILIC